MAWVRCALRDSAPLFSGSGEGQIIKLLNFMELMQHVTFDDPFWLPLFGGT